MITVSFYDPVTGLFDGTAYSGPEKGLALNANSRPYVIGLHDHICKRVDVETNEVIDHQPASPGDDYEWTGQRWRLNASAKKKIKEDRDARLKIQKLEEKQLRPMRELAIGDLSAKERIAEIDAEIAAERAKLIPAKKDAK